jgi:hypothetical protein
VWNLTKGMLGSRDNPGLSAKAAETEGLLEFVTEVLSENLVRFGTCGKTEEIRNNNLIEAKLLLAACGAALNSANKHTTYEWLRHPWIYGELSPLRMETHLLLNNSFPNKSWTHPPIPMIQNINY